MSAVFIAIVFALNCTSFLNAQITPDFRTKVAEPASESTPTPSLSSIEYHHGCDLHARSCPRYSIALTGDGIATFDATNVLVPGRRRVKADPADFVRLIRDLRKAGFWTIESTRAGFEPHSSVDFLRVSFEGVTKELAFTSNEYEFLLVDNAGETEPPRYVQMREIFNFAHQALVAASGAERWLVGNGDTVPSLRAEHFNFRSIEGAALLSRVVSARQAGIALQLLNEGAPISVGSESDMGGFQRGPVEAALLLDEPGLVRKLMASAQFRRLDADAKGAMLAAAAGQGSVEFVDILLDRGANPNVISGNGSTPLLALQNFGAFGDKSATASPTRLKIAETLIGHGADPNQPDHIGDQPLHFAADAEMVRLLISKGAKLEVRNKLGQTPVLRNFNDDAVVAMIEAGADYAAVGNCPPFNKPGMFIRHTNTYNLTNAFAAMLAHEQALLSRSPAAPLASGSAARFQAALAIYLDQAGRGPEAEPFFRAVLSTDGKVVGTSNADQTEAQNMLEKYLGSRHR